MESNCGIQSDHCCQSEGVRFSIPVLELKSREKLGSLYFSIAVIQSYRLQPTDCFSCNKFTYALISSFALSNLCASSSKSTLASNFEVSSDLANCLRTSDFLDLLECNSSVNGARPIWSNLLWTTSSAAFFAATNKILLLSYNASAMMLVIV